MPNRLVHETSPYLLQHADNPVDWYPWGGEAFEKARSEDKPIVLSVGYSACHWCHVMERESFESEGIALQMNRDFVCIKVDREERPDVDSVYMQALQAMTGRGGWPMTMFLTPEGKPFFGGTYYPPEDRDGSAGFPRILQAVATAYRQQRGDVAKSADEVVRRLHQMTDVPPAREPLTADLLSQAAQRISQGFDPEHGGFGTAPKFPQPLLLELLLRIHHRTGDDDLLGMVELTLQRMAHGGIYDHLGGGFHRYSTDPFWLVPHFEKMLYDNALLSRLYLYAYQVTGNLDYRRVAEETLDYVRREMTTPLGGFFSAQDADSEGEEGTFYVWSPREVMDVLGPEGGALFNQRFGVTWEGNFEGKNILSAVGALKALAQKAGVTEEELQRLLQEARERLLTHRRRRVPPATDEKALTAWNGLMLRSFAEAASILQRDDYREVARASAAFILEHLRQDGRLLRSYRDGQARVKGYLEDHAFFIEGLLALYEATFELRWLNEARALADQMVQLFWSQEQGAFYDTGTDQEELVVRPRDIVDNASPSGGSVAAMALLRLATLTGLPAYQRMAAQALRSVQPFLAQAPGGLTYWLCALDYYLSTPKEIALVGNPADPRAQALRREVFQRYLPNKVVAGYDPAKEDEPELPILEGRTTLNGQPTAYVCENFMCMMPVTDPKALAQQLEAPAQTPSL